MLKNAALYQVLLHSKANQISYLLFTSLRNENAFDLSYSCNHRLCVVSIIVISV